MLRRGSAHAHSSVPASRAGRAWVALALGIIALVVIIVFIIENSKSTPVTFFGVSWRIPLGLDLLLAAVLGGLVAFLLGTVRIVQLRRVARHRPASPVEASKAEPPGELG